MFGSGSETRTESGHREGEVWPQMVAPLLWPMGCSGKGRDEYMSGQNTTMCGARMTLLTAE